MIKKLFSFLATMMLATSMWAAEMEGPWTWMDMRSGCCSRTENYSIAFNGLNNSHWGTIKFWNDDDGIGYTLKGSSSRQQKNGIFSTYYIDRNVESYSRQVLTWKYKLGSRDKKHYSNTCLYALQGGWQQINALVVDFTEEYNNKSGSGNLIGQLRNTSYQIIFTSELTRTFSFDNRSGSSNATKSWCLLLTHVVSSADPMSDLHEWGSFLSTGATWITYYYKYVNFNANGGSGSMGTQTIENSGKLNNNAFSRTGYTFDGWATSANGGKAYNNQGDISATSGSKGYVTLYARWRANTYTVSLDQQSGKGGSASCTATYNAGMPTITVPTRTGYTFNGYYTGTNGSGTKYYNANGTSARNWDKTSNTTLYASWTPITYTITYDLDGGTVHGTNPTSYTIASNEIILIEPTKTGYTFIGWTGSNGSTPQEGVYIAKGSTGNKNYKANWIHEDQNAADHVKNLIDAIPSTITLTPQCHAAIAAAQGAYASLTDEQKALVGNEYTQKLLNAEASYADLVQAADQAAADAVIAKIQAIGEVVYTAECKAKIDDALAAYNALTDAQKGLVGNDWELALDEVEVKYEELARAVPVETLIDAIGSPISLTSQEAIEAARAAYDALTQNEKDLVKNYNLLLEAEVAYADLVAAKNVEDLIAAIGEVAYTDECRDKIVAARVAYDALSDAQKALVSNYTALTAAETSHADLVAAKEVENLIAAIGEVVYTDECSDKMMAARAEYDALSETQKAMVSNYAALTAAESAYAELALKRITLTIPAKSYLARIDADKRQIEVAVSGVSLYSVKSVTDSEVELTDELNVVSAEMPYLIYNDNDVEKNISIVVSSDEADDVQYDDVHFKGTLTDKTFTDEDMAAADHYVLQNGQNFVWVKDAGTLAAGKCWIELNLAVTAHARRLAIVKGDDMTPTGISNAPQEQIVNGKCFDLQGRRVPQPTKGLFIVNGKKVVKK